MRYFVAILLILALAAPLVHRSFMNKQHEFEQQLQRGFEKAYEEGYSDGNKKGFKAGLRTCDDVLASIDANGRY